MSRNKMTRCQHEVSAVIPGKGWGTIQCDEFDAHGKVRRPAAFASTNYPAGGYDHGNATFGVHWNEDHENAILPDMPETQDVPEFGTPDDPEPTGAQAFVIHTHGNEIIAVADSKAARDDFLRVYNLNRHSDRAVWSLVTRAI